MRLRHLSFRHFIHKVGSHGCRDVECRSRRWVCHADSDESVQDWSWDDGDTHTLEHVNNIRCANCLAAARVYNGANVSEQEFEARFKNGAGLLVDKLRDALDTPTARESADAAFCDTHDVLAQYLYCFASAVGYRYVTLR